MIRKSLIALGALAAGLTFASAGAALADASSGTRGSTWTDPFGCQHYFFNEGTSAFMANILNRDGSASCGHAPSAVPSGLGIWLDPDGCAHWYLDSGTTGYLANVRFPNGRPSCGGSARQLASEYEQPQLVTTIWRAPDGCSHWVADDGFEGFMSSRLRRDGTPVCNSAPVPPQVLQLAGDALFDSGSAALKPEAEARLATFFDKVRAAGKSRIAVVGHTDSDGSAAANDALSVARATSVAAFGANYGVASDISGAGESQPVVPNDSPANKAKNRRVEITVLD